MDQRFNNLLDLAEMNSEMLNAIWTGSDTVAAIAGVARLAETYAPSPAWSYFADATCLGSHHLADVLAWTRTMLEKIPNESDVGIIAFWITSLKTFLIEAVYARHPPLRRIPEGDDDEDLDWTGYPRRDALSTQYLDRVHELIRGQARVKLPNRPNVSVIPYAFLDAYVIGAVRAGLEHLPLSLWLGNADTRSVHIRVGEYHTPVAEIRRDGWTAIRTPA